MHYLASDLKMIIFPCHEKKIHFFRPVVSCCSSYRIFGRGHVDTLAGREVQYQRHAGKRLQTDCRGYLQYQQGMPG